MMHPDSGEYFAISGSGRRIWELLIRPMNPSEIVAVLCDEFEVDQDTCNEHVSAFLSTLCDLGLVNEV